jgi:hypothetical protein
VAAVVAVLAGTAAAAVACGSASGAPGTLPVPTFPESGKAAGPGGASPGYEGRLPDDCTRVLAENDLGALFGLPLDSVAVRTTLGVPAPAVGRTERLACTYSRKGDRNGQLLAINIGAYTDAAAAGKQWQTNVAAEDGARRDVPLGNARAALVERPAEAVLMVANGAETLTFALPERVRIGNLSAADTLVDLALRVLPAVSGAVGAAPPATPSPPPGAANVAAAGS